jgi:acetyl-CoA carboxylase carboxyl transferase subunit beta
MRISSSQWLNQYLQVKDFNPFFVDIDFSRFTYFDDYLQKVSDAQEKTGLQEAVLTGEGMLHNHKIVLAIFEPNFIMGTMSSGVGKLIVNALNEATKRKLPFLMITASGGARLQEGVYAVLQMANIQFAYDDHKNAGLKSINILADPTMGGVSASFAFLADEVAAIENSQIGFTGISVIKENFKSEIPEDFQKPEALLKNGSISTILKPDEVRNFIEEKLNA